MDAKERVTLNVGNIWKVYVWMFAILFLAGIMSGFTFDIQINVVHLVMRSLVEAVTNLVVFILAIFGVSLFESIKHERDKKPKARYDTWEG